MIILNLGSGSKTSNDASVINIDWSVMLRIRKNVILSKLAPVLLNNERRSKFNEIPSNILVHDLKKGIPYPEGSVDAVYHSHMFEHLDRDVAERFLLEVKRVLKPGGIHRIVVPDFEILCKKYSAHILEVEANPSEAQHHDEYFEQLLEQSVRREASGTSKQNSTRRFVENLLLGDARSRGETHQWMYDRINLAQKLKVAGYRTSHVMSHDKSNIPNWNTVGLDLDSKGQEYKPESLYMEAIR